MYLSTQKRRMYLFTPHIHSICWQGSNRPSLSTVPNPDTYFSQHLFVWMPKEMLKVDFKCPSCTSQCPLNSKGTYKSLRRVLHFLGGGQGRVVRGRDCVLDDTLSTQKRLMNCCNNEMIYEICKSLRWPHTYLYLPIHTYLYLPIHAL